jgi:transcriptional regulator with XRE-family HTH domain
MRLSAERIRALCAERSVTLTEMLERASVSRTAYYALVRKQSVLPGTVRAIADELGVEPSKILVQADPPERRAQVLLRLAKKVIRSHPQASFENVWHTLMLLEEPPIERLKRSLQRGRGLDLH